MKHIPFLCALLTVLAAPTEAQQVRDIEEVVSTQSAGVAPILLRGPVALGAIALGGLSSGGSGGNAGVQGQASQSQTAQTQPNLGGLSNSSGPGSTFASVILGGGGAANGTTGTTTSTTRTVK